MILWKTWFDLRYRFLVCIGIFLAIVILHIAIFPYLKELTADWVPDMSGTEMLAASRLMQDYVIYNDVRWFQEIERLGLFAIILSLGGVLTEARTRSIFITLSLPVSRRKWLLAQFGTVAAALLAMSLMGAILLSAGGALIGQHYSMNRALLGSLLLTVCVIPWIGLTLLTTTITGDRSSANCPARCAA